MLAVLVAFGFFMRSSNVRLGMIRTSTMTL
jgi:hypothetical protein